jgi:hypothetical protein
MKLSKNTRAYEIAYICKSNSLVYKHDGLANDIARTNGELVFRLPRRKCRQALHKEALILERLARTWHWKSRPSI